MRKGAALLALMILFIIAGKSPDTIAKHLDKAKLIWEWRPKGKDDRATEFRVRCGTASGSYDLPAVRVPFPKQEVSIKAVAPRPGRYFCVVTARNQAGESAPTNEVSFVVD